MILIRQTPILTFYSKSRLSHNFRGSSNISPPIPAINGFADSPPRIMTNGGGGGNWQPLELPQYSSWQSSSAPARPSVQPYDLHQLNSRPNSVYNPNSKLLHKIIISLLMFTRLFIFDYRKGIKRGYIQYKGGKTGVFLCFPLFFLPIRYCISKK